MPKLNERHKGTVSGKHLETGDMSAKNKVLGRKT